LHLVFEINGTVQLLGRMLVLVYRFLAGGVNMVMRVFVRMRMFMGVRMDHSIGVTVFMGVDVRMNVAVRVIVFDLLRHGMVSWKGVLDSTLTRSQSLDNSTPDAEEGHKQPAFRGNPSCQDSPAGDKLALPAFLRTASWEKNDGSPNSHTPHDGCSHCTRDAESARLSKAV
jgi:hypothetical protein